MNVFKKIVLFCTSTVLICVAATHTTKINGTVKQKAGVRRVVIDAGHGGVDIGARGSYSNEKTISLQVALLLEQEIKKQMPDVEVFMTRTTDIFDNPKVKANKANAAKGDLFIAIHCNDAAPSHRSEFIGYKTVKYKKGKKWKTRQEKQYRTYTVPNPAKGTETYIWGVGKNTQKEQALRDFDESLNDSTIAEENKKLNDPEQLAMVSLRMGQYAERSRNLAFSVQEEFVKVGRVNREARQRQVGIWVLQAVAMPAILVELGFISNPEEEAYLNSEKGQNELSECIARAVKNYKANIENKMINNSTNTGK